MCSTIVATATLGEQEPGATPAVAVALPSPHLCMLRGGTPPARPPQQGVSCWAYFEHSYAACWVVEGLEWFGGDVFSRFVGLGAVWRGIGSRLWPSETNQWRLSKQRVVVGRSEAMDRDKVTTCAYS